MRRLSHDVHRVGKNGRGDCAESALLRIAQAVLARRSTEPGITANAREEVVSQSVGDLRSFPHRARRYQGLVKLFGREIVECLPNDPF